MGGREGEREGGREGGGGEGGREVRLRGGTILIERQCGDEKHHVE